MGTITVNIPNDTEARFRAEVREHYGQGKGVLGHAVAEAFATWIKQKRQEDIAQELTDRMKQGWKGGKLKYRKREELYARA
jgi:hypothetical protein